MYIARRYSPSYVAILLYSLADPPRGRRLFPRSFITAARKPRIFHPVPNDRRSFRFISLPSLEQTRKETARRNHAKWLNSSIQIESRDFLSLSLSFIVHEIDDSFRSWREVRKQVLTMRTREGMQEMMVDRDGARGPREPTSRHD